MMFYDKLAKVMNAYQGLEKYGSVLLLASSDDKNGLPAGEWRLAAAIVNLEPAATEPSHSPSSPILLFVNSLHRSFLYCHMPDGRNA